MRRNPYETRLFSAIRNQRPQELATILSGGGNANSIEEDTGDTALYIATFSETSLLSVLLDFGAQPNLSQEGNSPPIFGALRSGNQSAVELLIAHGARVDLIDSVTCQNALHWAADRGSLQQLSLLLCENASGRDKALDCHDYIRRCPIHCAVATGSIKKVKLLIETGDCVDRKMLIEHSTPLHLAAARRDIPMLNLLLEHKASVIERDMDGHTPPEIFKEFDWDAFPKTTL